MTYEFKTKPFDHQLRVFNETKDTPWFAIFWEQGTGKSKLTLDTAGHLFDKGEIDCLFVVAPNGVHRNWTSEEIGNHWNDDLLAQVQTFTYHASKAKTQKHAKAAEDVLKHKGLAVIAMSYDALITKAGKPFAKQVLTKRRCLYVLDESARIKNPKARRTKTILASAKYAQYKRILTGTPVANGPFDVYAQMKFLEADYWKPRGLGNYTMFKNYFGIWFPMEVNGRTFPKLSEYQNLEFLKQMIDPNSSRVLKEDVLDLPPKLYSKRFFAMSPKQAKLYQQLRDEFMAEFEGGLTITADLAITRMLRLQQITCGYVQVEKEKLAADGLSYDIEKEIKDIEPTNERTALLYDILEDLPHKAIIWARFRRDIDMICKHLGDRAVRIDGKVGPDERAAAVDSFQHCQHGNAQFLVANQQAASEGYTFTQAKTVVYYNNSFKLTERLQSEDRAHRIGQNTSVQYIDIVAEDTLDERIIDALRGKLDIANQITGDGLKDWI